jgi:hypothetical protein
MEDRVVLSHGDAVLRQVDLDSLRGDAWLTDAVLTLQFTLLSERWSDALFVDASVAFFLSHCDPSDVAIVAGPLRLAERKLVLCLISDSTARATAYSGSHWALLAYWTEQRCFRLYNSLGRPSTNCLQNATAVARGLSVACGIREPPLIETPATPQQTNSCDCGLHALLTAEALATSLEKGRLQPSLDGVTPAAARALRQSLLAQFESMAAEQHASFNATAD